MKYTVKYKLAMTTPKPDEMCKYSVWIPCKCKKCTNE